VQEHFETYVDLLMRRHRAEPSRGFDARALQAAERARARGLLESLSEAGAGARLTPDARRDVSPELLERERSLRARVAAAAGRRTRLLGGAHTEAQAAAARKEVAEALDALEETETRIRAASPHYAALASPATLTLSEIQSRVLDPETVLLEYALGAQRSYLWAATHDSLASFELPPRAEVERAARRVFELLTARNKQVRFETAEERRSRVARADEEFADAAHALSRMILAPASARLGRKRLLVVADGALQYVPFAALPDPTGAESRRQGSRPSTSSPTAAPLVAAHEVVSLPSASTLDVLRRELAGRKPAARQLAILADPVFEKADERVRAAGAGAKTSSAEQDGGAAVSGIRRLPFTRREAEAIAALVPASERLVALGFDASRETATGGRLAGYRYVHFATHGLLDAAHPELSGLALSLVDERGRERDGFLHAYEIYGLRLPAELVVLSGCRTGLGKEVRGEGLVGLTRGFMYAGSARVLVSLWDVADEASAELMSDFYRGLLGRERLSPAAALRAAQLSVMRRRPSPYYWAAFTLQGENR
jgi:CHAT domain-containing protein